MPSLDTSRRSLDTSRRRSSQSFGEAAWLVKHHEEVRQRAGSFSEKRFSGVRRFSKRHSNSEKEPTSSCRGRRGGSASSVVTNPIGAFATEPLPAKDVTDQEAAARAQSRAEGEIIAKQYTKGVDGDTTKVNFSTCTVRYYETIVGDNPGSRSPGPSLSIGWEYDPSSTDADIPVDIYEEIRSPHRRAEWDLELSRVERERRLLDRGYSRASIAHAIMENTRIKNQRRQTVLNLKAAGAEELAEGVFRSTKKMLFHRRSTTYLYDEWKSMSEGIHHEPSEQRLLQVEESLQQPGIVEISSPSSTLSAPPTPNTRNVGSEAGNAKEVQDSLEEKEEKGNTPVARSRAKEAQKNSFGISRSSLSTRVVLEPIESKDDDEMKNEPFATIDIVFPGSPADDAGLQKDDLLLKFGSVSHKDQLNAVAELCLFASAKEKSIPVIVFRNDKALHLSIRPREWNGRGRLGFLLRPLLD